MRASGGELLDSSGRHLFVRGINVSGSSKVPALPDGATHIREGFYAHREVSFVGRPFPLDEATEHFARLRRWGFDLVRLLVTWEAVEHAGPGRYDRDYLDYLDAITARAGEAGLMVLIDLHQDTWSRFCGGSGAPGWTLEAVGMDLRRIDETGAAITHQAHVQPYEAMIWATNACKLAAATMFTLFFAGDMLAPRRKIDGSSVQRVLQAHYLETLRRIGHALRSRENVVGYDPINEPHAGYIGCGDLEGPPAEPRIGASPTPLQSMALGAGIPQEVTVWRFGSAGSRARGTTRLNPARVRLWRDADCPWREHGVWAAGSDGQPRLLQPDYFQTASGHPIDFEQDCYRPFLEACGGTVQSAHPDAMLFVEPAQGAGYVAPPLDGGPTIVSAPHWYDGSVLMLKRYSPLFGVDSIRRRVVIGPRRVRRSYRRQMEHLKAAAVERLAGAPTFIGEVGVPFDLRAGWAAAALQRSLRAMEDAVVSYAIWSYTPENSKAHGDGWNTENLSIYSREEGARALRAVVRPYVRAAAGRVLRTGFEPASRLFEVEVEDDPSIDAPTEIFVSNLQYPNGFSVELSDGRWEHDAEAQVVRVYHSRRARHRIRILPRTQP